MLCGLFIFSNRSGCSKNKIKIKVDVELGGSLKFFFRYYIFLFSLLVYNDFIQEEDSKIFLFNVSLLLNRKNCLLKIYFFFKV